MSRGRLGEDSGSGAGNGPVFAFLFAIAVLFHESRHDEWTQSVFSVLAVVMALAVLVRPGSPRLLLALVVCTLGQMVWSLPLRINSWVFVFYMNLALLGGYVRVWWSTRRLPGSLDEIEQISFPAIRLGVIALWLIAALHKFNSSFFDPTHSCAVEHFTMLHRHLPMVPEHVGTALAWVLMLTTIVVELSIPVLLFFRRTRVIGLLVAAGFHLVMTMNLLQAFGSSALAFYSTFLPCGFGLALGRWYAMRRRPWLVVMRWLPLAVFGVVAADNLVLRPMLSAGIVDGTPLVAFKHRLPTVWGAWLFVVFELAVVGVAVRVLLWERVQTWCGIGRPGPFGVVLLVLFLLNGLSAYLGLNTRTGFDMFSNLRTEGGEWNHLFVPKAVHVFGFTDDLVRIIETDARGPLRADAEQGHRITAFEFRRGLAEAIRRSDAPIRLVWEHHGEVFSTEDAEHDPRLSERNNPILERVLMFRPVPDEPHCLQ